MKNKIFMVLLGSFVLSGCASEHPYTPPPSTSDYDAYAALSETAVSVNQSLTQLGATEQAAYPPVKVAEPPNPASYGMDVPASIDWNGPVEPLVQQIANSTNYQLHVLGPTPAIPIVVSISAQNTPMGDILRDTGYQCGKRADIVVFPSTHIIELRYAKP